MSDMQQAAVAAKKSKMSVRDICYAGLFAAVIAVMAQISIPMPMGVPMTMQTFAITLAAVVLGSKLSTISSLIYIIMGAVGLPVLANFSGGFDKFVGPTGGFLLSFPLMAFIIGWGAEHRKDFKGAYVIALVVGTVVNYVVGVALFCAVAKASVHPHRHHQGDPRLRDRLCHQRACAGAEEMIYLRPHHLLCTQGYSGKGYDENFVAHMNEVVHELRNVPGTRIMLTFSTDTLCSCCPHKEGEDLCDTQEKVKRFDRKTIEYFGLEEKEYVYQDLIREIDEKMTSEMLADICRDCEWFPISACRKNICGNK